MKSYLFCLLIWTCLVFSQQCVFDYEGDIDANWRVLGCTHTCDKLVYNQQSPVQIDAEVLDVNYTRLQFIYPNETVTVKAYHTTEEYEIKIEYPVDYTGGFINPMLSSEFYQLQQFHFHTYSEHVINVRNRTGRNDAVLHMVHHNNVTDKVAVIALLFNIGNQSTEIINEVYELIKNVNASNANVTFDGNFTTHFQKMFAELQAADEDSYWYLKGSFTTPPCTEDVDWHILTKEFTVTQAQWDKLHNFVGNNTRPIQRVLGDSDPVHYFDATYQATTGATGTGATGTTEATGATTESTTSKSSSTTTDNISTEEVTPEAAKLITIIIIVVILLVLFTLAMVCLK